MTAVLSLNGVWFDYCLVDPATGQRSFIGCSVPAIMHMDAAVTFSCHGGDDCDCNFCEDDDGDSDTQLG